MEPDGPPGPRCFFAAADQRSTKSASLLGQRAGILHSKFIRRNLRLDFVVRKNITSGGPLDSAMSRQLKHPSRSREEPALPSPRHAGLKGGAAHGRPATLHGEVLSKLRDYIAIGPLSEGTRIPERELCALFGISRTPLREALKVLASEGLVDLLPNRGARVRTLTEQDIRELFDLMAGLEALAGRLACEYIAEEEIGEIERLHHEMYAFYLRKEADGYYQANQMIHTKIVQASRNAALSMAYASFTGRMRRIRYSTNQARRQERWAEAMREHEAILDALRRRAGSELSDILFMHLRHKQAAALAHWTESKAGP